MSFDSPTGTAQGPYLAIDWRNRPGSERDQTYESIGINDRSGTAVNVVSGNLNLSAADIHLPGVAGLDLDVARSYNTGDLADQHLSGSAWMTTVNGAALDLQTQFLSGGRTLYANGGAVYRFDRDTTADTTPAGGVLMYGYTTPPGIDATMQQSSTTGATIVTFRDGTVWTYSGGSFYGQVLTQIKDRHNNHIDLTYDSLWGSSGQSLKKITDTYGRDLTVTRSLPSGTVTGMTDSSGRHWAWNIDAGDHYNLDSATDPDNKTVSYTYYPYVPTVWDMLKKVTDARGHDISLGYGGSSGASQGSSLQLTSLTRAVDGNSGHDIVWRWNYVPASGVGDNCTATGVVGRTVETDPEGHLTTYCYNKHGQVIQTFDGEHRSVTAEYTASANVAKFTGLAGTGNPSITNYSFSANGSPQGSSTAVGSRTQTSVIKYCGTATGDTGTACTGTYPLDKYLPQTFTDSQGTTQGYTYNSVGDLTDVTTTSGSDRQTFTYDGHGNVATSKDGNNNTTTYAWTSDFLTKVTPPAPLAALNFGPDSLGRIKWAQNGNLVFSCMTYDGVDRVTRVDWKTGVTGGNCATGTTVKWMTFTYDANGNVTQRQDGSNTTTYGYDWANRRTSETFPSSRTNTYSYDRASNLTCVVDADGTVSYTYDAANRLKTIVSPKGAGTSTITYTYTDPASSTDPSLQTISFPGGIRQETKTDAAGNIFSVHVLNGSTVLKKRDYTHQYGAASNSALIQTMSDNAGNTTTYTLGAMNRLKDVVTTNGGSTTEAWHYAYDAAGNRTLRQRVVGATTTNTSYGYNAANQLCYSIGSTATGTCGAPPSGATTYSYDGAGQRTTNPTAAFDQIQRLTTLTGTSLGYLSPGNGELVAYGTTNYQNNLMGLSRIIPPSGSATDIIRTPNGAPLAQRTGTSSKQALFTDALGSVLATADDGATSLSRHYSYDPDGNVNISGSGTDSVLRYAGGHPVGNLYHYGARYYDPNTAVWTQQDPLNQMSSLTEANRYTYAGGNPINNVDLSGLSVLSRLVGCAAGGTAGLYSTGLPNPYRVAAGCILGAAAGERYSREGWNPPGPAQDPPFCKDFNSCPSDRIA